MRAGILTAILVGVIGSLGLRFVGTMYHYNIVPMLGIALVDFLVTFLFARSVTLRNKSDFFRYLLTALVLTWIVFFPVTSLLGASMYVIVFITLVPTFGPLVFFFPILVGSMVGRYFAVSLKQKK
jgi:hypothetical protein